MVADSQRDRLLKAMTATVGRRGYRDAHITEVVGRAGVSRRTFYEHFEGKEDCFLAAYELIAEHFAAALAAAEAEPEWPERVRALLATLLEIFAADPTVARFVLLESLAAGGEVATRHRASLHCFAALLRPADPNADDALAAAREQALVGGLSTLVVRRLKASEADRLPELLPDLHELVLTSYLGRGEAQRRAREAAA